MTNYQAKPMQNVGNWLKKESVETLFDIAKKHNLRNWLILHLLLRTGRRIGELLQLKPADINFQDSQIKWNIEKKRTKKDYQVWKTIDSESIFYLKQYIEYHKIKDFEYVFYSPYKGKTHHITRNAVWYFLNKYAKETGIEVHPHSFRHTFAVWIVQNMEHPGDLKMLKELLEHSDIKMTEQYLQFSTKESKKLLEKTFNKNYIPPIIPKDE